MAIKQVKKIHLFFMKDELDSILNFFQKRNIVELKQIELPEIFKNEYVSAISVSDSVQNKSVYLSKLQKIINVLSKFDIRKKTFIEKFTNKILVSEKKDIDIEKFCYAIDKKLSKLDAINLKVIDTAERISELKPWISVRTDLMVSYNFKWIKIIAGIMAIDKYDNFCLEHKTDDVVFSEIFRDTKEVYFVASVLKEHYNKIFDEIGRFGRVVKWHNLKTSPMEIYQKLQMQLQKYNKRYENLKNNIHKNIKYLDDFKLEYDKVYNEWLKDLEKENLVSGQYVGVLSGWICQDEIDDLRADLQQKFEHTYLIVEDPKDDEEIPTAFENSAFVSPFEIVTDLYGRPKYKGIDPTPLLFPFFWLFFGICLGDAGYGLILLVASIFLLSVFKNNPTAKKPIKLLLFMGISTTIIGLITGTFFGNLVEFLPESLNFVKNGLNKLVLLNPIGEKGSLIFLALALAVGYLQLCFGVLVKASMFLKQKDFKGFILEGVSVFAVQLSLMPLTLYYILGIKIFPENIMFGFKSLLLVGMFIIAYKEWISNEGFFIKLFWCLYGNYTVITGNFLSDTLSYARLFALGLSGGLLGFAINEISSVFKPIPFVGVIVMIVIMILGHLFNMAICFLGAFVHTARLQYLEFFTKFFESGGRAFRPFKKQNKYVID